MNFFTNLIKKRLNFKNMGARKTIQFNKEKVSASTIYLAISHPARLQMIESIRKSHFIRAKELEKDLGVSRTSLLYHLDILKELGIVQYDYDTHHYLLYINEAPLEEARDFLSNLIGQ
jgi:predicted transcriptional regulator